MILSESRQSYVMISHLVWATCFQMTCNQLQGWLEFGLKRSGRLAAADPHKQPAVRTGGGSCYATSSCAWYFVHQSWQWTLWAVDS